MRFGYAYKRPDGALGYSIHDIVPEAEDSARSADSVMRMMTRATPDIPNDDGIGGRYTLHRWSELEARGWSIVRVIIAEVES